MSYISWSTDFPMPSSMTMGLAFNTLRMPPNPLTGSMRTVGMPGARWLATLGWDLLDRVDADYLKGVLMQLQGQTNRLVLWDLVQPYPRGAGSGSPVINGAGQQGVNINITGATPNITAWVYPGDKFEIGGELKIATAQSNTNGLGQTTLSFQPPTRASPANGGVVKMVQPAANFVLESNTISWEYGTGVAVRNMKISLIEAFI